MLEILKSHNTLEQDKPKQEYEGKKPKNFIELLKTQPIQDIRTLGKIFSLYSHHTLQQRFLHFIIIFMEQLSANFKDTEIYNLDIDIAPMASEITNYLRTKRISMPIALT